jgi:uncharacterized integral membrane protein (TIGR00697 family)
MEWFNLWVGAGFALLNFCIFLLGYRLFGRTGLYAWMGIATVLANIQVVKTIVMFGMVMTLGNTMYGTLYLTTDLLNEKYGERAAKKAVWFGFFTLIATTIIMQVALVFHPQPEDIAQPALQTIFGLMPRVALGSLTAYLVSQNIDVRLFSLIRRRFPKPNQLWIRNNGSTLLSQLVDTLIFTTIAFWGVYSFEVWFDILITTYFIKFIVSWISTPFLYIARSLQVPEEH